MNEDEFNNEQNFGNQSPSFETNKRKKNQNKKNTLIPLIVIIVILVVLFILFKDIMLQLLGVILIIICIGFVLLKAIQYIIAVSGCLFNIIIGILAFIFILTAAGWVMELFS